MGKMTRFFGAACIATGTVAMSGLVASGAAVYSIAEGFITAGKMIKDALKEEEKGHLLLETEKADVPCLNAGTGAPQNPAGEVSQ